MFKTKVFNCLYRIFLCTELHIIVVLSQWQCTLNPLLSNWYFKWFLRIQIVFANSILSVCRIILDILCKRLFEKLFTIYIFFYVNLQFEKLKEFVCRIIVLQCIIGRFESCSELEEKQNALRCFFRDCYIVSINLQILYGYKYNSETIIHLTKLINHKKAVGCGRTNEFISLALSGAG